ncbi:hypothetical protein DW268_07015 [Agathobacter rectalis]|nr:hypothetical protein DW268_07015 [Agathobacter rectalis]
MILWQSIIQVLKKLLFDIFNISMYFIRIKNIYFFAFNYRFPYFRASLMKYQKLKVQLPIAYK